MRARRHVPYREDDTFGINASDTLMSAWKNLTGTIFAVTIGLVAVFMVVGGIVIMNIMLASVTERTHEIGIRKSLGARRRDILWQFVIESGVMASMGGIAGVLLAVAIARVVNMFFTAEVPLSAVVVGVTLSAAVGLFFGIYPAQQGGAAGAHRGAADRRIEIAMLQAYRQHVRENLLLALDTLRTHKFRSFLTVLGVLIGTTTVIAVTSIIAGLDKQLVDVAEQFGTRTLWVYKLQTGRSARLDARRAAAQAAELRRRHGHQGAVPSAATVSVELFREMGDFGLPPVTARYKGQDMLDALFVGVTADHLRLINATLGEGRFFTETDDLHRRDVAVIGNGVRERFFAHEDPIGKTHSGGRAQPGSHRHPDQVQVVPGRRPERQGHPHSLPHRSRRPTPRPRTTSSACWWSRARWIRRRTR